VGIRGEYHVDAAFFLGSNYMPPAYCFNCGNSFEWTKRKITGAVALLEADGSMSPAEIGQFKTDLIELTKETP